MESAIVIGLLALAGTAFPGPASSVDLPESVPAHSTTRWSNSPGGVAPTGAFRSGQYVYEVCGVTLRRLDGDYNCAMYTLRCPAPARVIPAWKRAGICGLEFTGAAIGALVAGALGVATIEGIYQAGYNGRNAVPAGVAYCLTSAVLSAGAAHLVGRLLGHRNAFNHALAGGAIGGLAGGGAFVDYFATRRRPHTAMGPIALALPPLGAVIAYNVWGNDDTE